MLEFERYELRSGPAYHFDSDRRDFLKLLGGGLLVLLVLDGEADGQESGRTGRRRRGGEALPQNIGAWLHIGPDGAITVYTGKAEMGQNIRTSLTQAVAGELRCPIASVHLVMADTAVTPYDMGTFGSRTTPTMAPQLRKMAAGAREALAGVAAERWGLKRDALTIEDGRVMDRAAGKTASFGELAVHADLVKMVPEQSPVTPASEWHVAGKSAPKVDARDFVTGKHQYAADVKRPGMLYGCILRPTSFDATLASIDTSAAERMPGVKVIHEGDFVGVAAPDEWTARKAVDSIRAEWKTKPQISSRELFDYLKSNPDGSRDEEAHGSIEDGLRAADKTVQSTYTVAYIQHVPLEPRAAVAEWDGNSVKVWTGSQRPFGVRSDVAQAFGMPEERVRVIVPDTGSAYGGKHTGECAIEAARLAKGAGKPVSLIWTREEEFTWAYFRPAGVIEARSGAAKDGTITAWEFQNYNSGPSAVDTPYEITNQRCTFHPTKYPLRQGSYRGLAATANHFARESHMDELAAAIGMDPLEFRRKNLKNPRILAVLDAAAKRFGWGEKPKADHGVGLACGTEKGGYIACCAEVSITRDRQVKIERVVEAFECGAVVNPEHLKNQIEGAILMATGGALFEAIDFADGRILNPRLSKYRVPHFHDAPAVEVVLVDRKDLPSAGAGETPIVGLAPAIANAIYYATGVRVRSMPILPAFQAGQARS